MNLRKCYIENFGKLHQFEYEFSEGLNLINKSNGWGKSTFATFIKAMFYGFDTSNKRAISENERKKYYPWQGGKFGGNLEFEINGKIYEIERFFGIKDKDDTFRLYDKTTNCESYDFSQNIGEEIFKLDRQAYERSTYISGQAISVEINDSLSAKLSNILENENDINTSEEAINRIVSIMKEYKKTGNKGKINELETKINNKKRELEYTRKNEELIEERRKKIEESNLQIRQYEQKKNENQEKINKISEYENDQLKRELEILNERLEKQRKIEKLQEQNNKKKKNKIIISVLIILISIILGIFFSKYLYLISIIGVLILIIGILEFNKAKSKYEKDSKYNTPSNTASKENNYKTNKEEIIKENELLSRQITELINQKSYDENEMNRLINTEISTEEIENEIENLEQELREMNYKYNILDKTRMYLSQAKEKFSSHYLKGMTQGFEKYLNILNSDKLDTNIDIKLNVKIEEYGEKKEIDYLSTGYRDLIGICMRLALIEALFENENPFIILDDPFVNLDEEKIEKAKQVVQELSKKYQVIYFVCHECRKCTSGT
ncbi:MAG: AAA family ATPase [Clostridia bacterium]|nr:AAA family ATPase [Clostridia bacterium]